MAEDKRPPFLRELRVQDNTELVADVLALAKAVKATPELWAIFERVTDQLEVTEEEGAALGRFQVNFFSRLGKKRPLDAGMYAQILRQVAAGKMESVTSPQAVKLLKETCRFN